MLIKNGSTESFFNVLKKYTKILNYVEGIEIKMTKDRGRGVFATKFLKKNTLIVVEKAIAEAE